MKNIKKESKSILFKTSKLNNLKYGEEEGTRLVNVSTRSKLFLDKLLSPGHTSKTMLFCGRVAKIITFMRAIKTPGFPLQYLEKSNFTPEETASIPRETVALPNYWALVAYAVVERVKQDKKLIEMLKANTLELTCLEAPKNVEVLGRIVTGHQSVAKSMAAYISILRNIELMIKEETFDKKEVTDKFIMDCRDDPTQDVFANIQIPVEVKQ